MSQHSEIALERTKFFSLAIFLWWAEYEIISPLRKALQVSQIVAADTSELTLVAIKRSMRLFIFLINSLSESSKESKRQGTRDGAYPEGRCPRLQ